MTSQIARDAISINPKLQKITLNDYLFILKVEAFAEVFFEPLAKVSK